MFKKFFGKKNDGFYLQLEDEDATSKPAPKAKVAAEPAPVTTPAPAAVTVEAVNPVTAPISITPAPVVSPAVAPAVSPAVAAAAAAVVKSNQQTAKANQKAAKAEEKAAKKNAKVVEAVVAPVPAAPAITNFATDYLMKPSSSSSRRLPGANMRGFLELARQVDKPKAFKAAASERKAGEK